MEEIRQSDCWCMDNIYSAYMITLSCGRNSPVWLLVNGQHLHMWTQLHCQLARLSNVNTTRMPSPVSPQNVNMDIHYYLPAGKTKYRPSYVNKDIYKTNQASWTSLHMWIWTNLRDCFVSLWTVIIWNELVKTMRRDGGGVRWMLWGHHGEHCEL